MEESGRRYSIAQPPDGSFGSLLPNGSWNGMVGMVIRKEVDLALGPFAITYDRSVAVDFSFPLLVDNVKILGRRGRTEVNEWSFVMPLGPLVWLMTFVSLLALVVVTKLLGMIERKIPFGGGPGYSTYIRIIFQQDVEDRQSLAWERVMVCFWALAVFVIFASYKSNLMSLLAVRYISEPYQTWRDMVEDESLTIIQFANTAQTQIISAAESGIFHDVAEAGKRGHYRLIPVPGFVPVVDKLVSRGDHVFLAPFLMMKLFLTEDYMHKGNCKFYASSEGFMESHLSLVFQKNSPLRIAMDRRIKGAIEGGLYEYWISDAIPNVGSCKRPPTKITVQESLSMNDLWGMFVVLVAGYVASFVAFVSEKTAAQLLTRHKEEELNLLHE
ncbi:glutamate receptor ionotropic, delta-1-like [Macrobrachium nipponense]|uniref:glutamate receptor ionotropic, delta-1-like n=1 Tax=Macrobrachium nipponense TaxID=159736 RepID=UPI0030C7A1CA